MENNKLEEKDNDSILYELLEYFVKKQEPELVRYNNGSAILSTTGTIKNALKYLNNSYSLPESISQQKGLTLSWKFAIGDNGRLLAILHENIIEIRRSKDEFSSVIGKAFVPKDSFPQWRKLSWSPDGTILVLASSNGHLSFYNSLGSNVFNINPKTESSNPDILEAGDAIASLIFKSPKADTECWSYEILLVTYSGLLKSYFISSHSHEPRYEFSFGNFYRKGVNAFVYDHHHNLYIVAGNSITQSYSCPAANAGLTSWRPINDYPYYKLSFIFEETASSHTLSIWNLIPKFRAPEESVIFRVSISPSCNHLVCLHTDGSISLWNLPNLQLQKKWKLSEQPGFDAQNPLNLSKYRKLPIGFTEFHPLDIGWWSDVAIIIARYSGAISVYSINDLKNLLGKSPEFLYGQPQISEYYSDVGILCLDCENVITTKKRIREPSIDGTSSESSDSEKEEDELEPLTFMNYATNLVRSALYSITDIESFQPKRKKSKILQRSYRILGLKSTTPEELYSRKIDVEEYEEALALAKSYDLDTDLVYQTQWRKSQFSLRAIQEHLSKVRKRSWILNECIIRVPETLEAARELLNFGLKGTNLETFLDIGKNDDGKIVISDNDDDLNQLNDASINLKYIQVVNEKLKDLKDVDLVSLSPAQKDLLSYRKSLLNHLDKLKTYEIIIEGRSKYNKEAYEEFRQLTILENAVKFARNCDHRAVEILFTYHGQKLMSHWLAIISCFPETLNPNEYKKLLPECDESGQLFLLYQQELRPKDWLEKPEFEALINNNNDDGSQLIYEAEPSLAVYKTTTITMDLLTKWYKARAYDIERNSCIVENAVELIKIARAHKILGLENFLLQLETLDDLIYKVNLDNISLVSFEKMSDLEKVKLLMSTSTEKSFVQNLKSFVLLFIYRKQKYLGGNLDKQLLKNFLMSLSEEDLKLPICFFENVIQDIELLNLIEDLVILAVDCIYSCTNPDMYEKAKAIFDCIPRPQPIKKDSGEIYDPVGDLERELECLKILNKYQVLTTIRFIHDNKLNADEIKLMLQQMSNRLNEMSPKISQDAWAEVLNDMCELQEFIFECISIEDCFETCVTSRLASGHKATIQNCTTLVETKKKENSLLKVSYDRTVKLILAASKNYFNNSKSYHDPNMELAKACLHIIEDENVLVQQEYDLINSLLILDEFNISILPLQVRLCQDRLKLIESCLKNKKGAYKRQQRLLTLASYLNIDGKDTRSREGKVLELIAEKSFEVKDYETCTSTCEKLIEMSYFHAWRVIQKLGFCDEFNDLSIKQRALTFTLTYGPKENIEKTLQQMHLLEIQVLNKNLENWMAVYELQNSIHVNDDSDDEFIDAMTTPQTEVKEFVPKILETSTELVKSSAQLVKESTLGILRNVSNQSFWRTALSINNKSVQDISDEEESIDKSSEINRGKVQSFPFLYASLHGKVESSRYDAKYDRYAMLDDENTKLKICQTLLRVNTLSETACYGLEVSDINHFLVQSATHVFADDWLLGMGYLLTLQNDYFRHAEEIFSSLPDTELFVLTAMYFYSLKLQEMLSENSKKWRAKSPMSLIDETITKVDEKMAENQSGKVENDDGNDDKEILNIKHHFKKWCSKLNQRSDLVDLSNEEKGVSTSDFVGEKILAHLNNDKDKGDDGKSDKDDEELVETGEIESRFAGVVDELTKNNVFNDVNNSEKNITASLYENEAFKMKSEEVAEAGEGWDDNWSDFSDANDEKIIDNAASELREATKVPSESPADDEVSEPEEKNLEIGAKSNSELQRLDSSDLSIRTESPEIMDDSTEDKRFVIFEKLFLEMNSEEDYFKIKEFLMFWPKFTIEEYTKLDQHPILRMIESVNKFIVTKSSAKSAILQEYKELLKEEKIDVKVLTAFTRRFDEKSSLEERIFLRLCVDDDELNKEAVELIKSSGKSEFSLGIFEELFFRNLTASFAPHHPVYNKILEEMFLNHTLDEIESNIRILIDKLLELKHIPYAIALWNQLAAVPSALSTFESCFQLFLRK